jgi:hypothetical protein
VFSITIIKIKSENLDKKMKKIKKKVGVWANFFGGADPVRSLYVKIRLSGERAKFLITERPSPSSSILLAGSGRSGTTWLTDLLSTIAGIQQIFEPLHPSFARELLLYNGSTDRISSHYIRPQEFQPFWHNFLERVLTGKVRHYMSDYIKNSYFPDFFLIKEIRANLMVGYILDHFNPIAIYVIRHPCAVVHSRLKVGWHADVRDILVQEKLVEDYLRPWLKEIKSETDLLGAHAVWWAVENLVATDQLKGRPHHFMFYEKAVLEPEKTASKLFSWIGSQPEFLGKITKKNIFSPSRPSRTANKGLTYNSPFDRLSYWKRSLPEESQKKVVYWARELGVSFYDSGIFPIQSVTSQ